MVKLPRIRDFIIIQQTISVPVYKKHFISKLTDSDGEQQETQHWIETAFDCGYLTAELRDDLIGNYESVGRMLNSMINKADSFCSQNSNKPITDYQITPV
jgi:hypothetical protein